MLGLTARAACRSRSPRSSPERALNYASTRWSVLANNTLSAAEDRRARGVRVRRALHRRGPGREPAPLVGGDRARRDGGRVRARALAGALQLPRLERLGLRRERDPRSRAQRAALALRRPRALCGDLPAGERALPLRAAAPGAARDAERRRGDGARPLRPARRHAGRGVRAALDPRHAERDDPPGGRASPTRWRSTASSSAASSACTPRRNTPAIAIVAQAVVRRPAARAAQLFRARSTTPPSRSCSRRSPTCSRCSGSARSSPRGRAPTAPGATPSIPALYVAANVAIAVGLAVGSPVSVGVSAIVIASALPFYGLLRVLRSAA